MCKAVLENGKWPIWVIQENSEYILCILQTALLVRMSENLFVQIQYNI